MHCRVLLFAGLAETVGSSAIELEIPGARSTVADLRRAVEAQFPALAGRTYSVAIDAGYARDEDPLVEGAEIAMIPPVSGG